MLTVLLIDDEKHVRDTVKSMIPFKEMGIGRVLEAENGQDGLLLMEQEKPHVVITDMKMPFCSGGELLRRSHEQGFRGKIIVLSGFDTFEYMREGIRYDAFDYLLKPINPFELNDTFKRAVACFGAQTPGPDFLDEIKAYIEKEYAEDIHLELFSKKFYMTKEYILRKYKEKFGTGIYEHVMSMRMQEAKRLLTQTDGQIQEIAFRVGFNDNHYFSKAFKAYFGMSPRHARSADPQEPAETE